MLRYGNYLGTTPNTTLVDKPRTRIVDTGTSGNTSNQETPMKKALYMVPTITVGLPSGAA